MTQIDTNSVKQFPMLTVEEEQRLVLLLPDKKAREILINSHLRQVVRIARGYAGYGLPMDDLISEGTVGLIRAVDKFDYEKGVRVATYAMWWITANIQEYVLRQWSLVRVGTTTARRSLFFKLRGIKAKLGIYELTQEKAQQIADTLGIDVKDIWDMEMSLKGDQSLNVGVKGGSPDFDSEGDDYIDKLECVDPSPEDNLITKQNHEHVWEVVNSVTKDMKARDKDIFVSRSLTIPSVNLATLAVKYGITKERVRQIEIRVYTMVKRSMKRRHNHYPVITYGMTNYDNNL